MSNPAPSALLLTTPSCPHCPAVKTHLERLHREGKLAALEIVDATKETARATELGVRSVPWIRIGRFEITGNQSYGELLSWIEENNAGSGTSRYYQHLLENRGLDQVIAQIQERPGTLLDLLPLLESLETPIAVRIGIGAVIEELAGSETLNNIVPELTTLTRSAEPQIRADACHYLGLTNNKACIETLRLRIEDENPDVREIAMESIAVLEVL